MAAVVNAAALLEQADMYVSFLLFFHYLFLSPGDSLRALVIKEGQKILSQSKFHI